jgi:HlyD family secretion protein
MKDESIFRRASLERLSSPERLDTLLEVTTPRSWFALAGLGAVVVAAIAWGVFGAVPDSLEGEGLMVRWSGLVNVESSAAGVVRDLQVHVGDAVNVGQPIGRLVQADVEDNLRQARARLIELERNRDLTRGKIARDADLERATIAQQRQQTLQTQESARGRIRFLETRIAANRELLRAGLINQQTYQDVVQQLDDARQTVATGESQLKALTAREGAVETQASQSVFSLEEAAADSRRQIETLEGQLAESGTISSPTTGKVVELLTGDGALVTRGQPLITIERAAAPLMGLTFIGSAAKQVRPGMRVQMSPAGVPWEEYGYMLGHVVSVSDSPLSPTAMNVLLRNDTLVRDFTARGAAYVVSVELERDGRTPSGFRWTSRQGPDLALGSGTLLQAKITLEQRRPIALVIPSLRKWLGL